MPFEQLLAVLPAASKDLLPKCYQVGCNILIKRAFVLICIRRILIHSHYAHMKSKYPFEMFDFFWNISTCSYLIFILTILIDKKLYN